MALGPGLAAALLLVVGQAGVLTPPRALTPTEVAPPAGAPPLTEARTVRVRMHVGATGAVTEAELLQGIDPAYDIAVLEGVRRFRFEPARYDGAPVEVDISFSQTFLPPPAAPPADEPAARLLGEAVEKGSRKAIGGATVTARREDGQERAATTDAAGRFELLLSPGRWRVAVTSAEHRRFEVQETLREDDRLEVRYLVERGAFDPYRTVVIGRKDREVVTRTTLRGREIAHIPGTFGDPFRVIGALPGVGSVMSLVPYPIVRGTSPGATGFLIDGVAVPQLFHFLAGPAVIHPEFIDRVDFHPGGFPVRHGGYIGGIVDGRTRRPAEDERRIDIDVDLIKTGGFVRGPLSVAGLPDVTGTGAFRIGYPGVLLDAFNAELYVRYWDYQARLDGGAFGGRWKAFGFGSYDESGEREAREPGAEPERLQIGFHRLDLSWGRAVDGGHDEYALVLGTERTGSTGSEPEGLSAVRLNPRAEWERALGGAARLRAGAEVAIRRFALEVPFGPDAHGREPGDGDFTQEDVKLDADARSVGLWVDAPLDLTHGLTATPGARLDGYQNSAATQVGVDPRLLVRWQAREDLALKGGAGVFHQPPRFILPVPGLEEVALERGLMRSLQGSVGAEIALPASMSLDVTAYYAGMDPVFFDLLLNDVRPGEHDGTHPGRPAGLDASGEGATEDMGGRADGSVDVGDLMLARRRGRSYGVEVLLRRKESSGVFGWLSYTASRSEREHAGDWLPYDFDRPHMLHVVLGLSLPRNWELGLRAQLQSGRPVSSPDGYNDRRLSPFFRFDLRIDKRAVWNRWMLDFYVDLLNATVAAEQVEDGAEPLRYVMPTAGFRGVL